jgi:Gram-negative bacterial TonB protein C-terminal
MRWICSIFLSFLIVGCLNAQQDPCNVEAQDPVMPVYAPIARAAHIEGIVRFEVTLSQELKPEVKLLDGHPMLAGAAQSYLEYRRYLWKEGAEHKACSYIAQMEYRIIEPQSDDRNDFFRVTILGLNHTLVEVQPIKPTCNDCKDFRCPLDGVTESKSPTYPPIARAAHVEGDVSARLTFDAKGQVTEVADWTGPEMLRQPTEDYLRSWRLRSGSMPSYMDSCQSTVLIEYRLTTASEKPSNTQVFRADPSHILIEDHGALQIDPTVEITKKKKFLGIF